MNPPDKRPRGVKHHNVKLTPEQVDEIRKTPGVYRKLAEKYGVAPSTICQIKRERTWKYHA